MLAGFLLTLREGLEAALIIGLLLGTLRKLDRPEFRKLIWFGAGTAILASLITGIILHLLGAKFEGRAEKIFEGLTMFLAAGVLTWMILWMKKQSREMNQKLSSGVIQAVSDQSGLALFSVAFLAVIREGVELALFLAAVSMNVDQVGVMIGAGLGLATVVVTSVLFFRSLIRLNIKRFFQATSIVLVFFAAGLVAHGVHEFNEAGMIPAIVENLWDVNSILDEESILGGFLKTLLGYNGNPSLTEVVSYLLYFIIYWAVGFKSRTKRKILPLNKEFVQ